MSTVIVVTNFSDASRNALEYTCRFLHNASTHVLLLNIFSFPAAINNDTLAIAALSETITRDEQLLRQEYAWVREHYPNMHIETEMVSGVFAEELRHRIRSVNAVLMVMGAEGNYTDLLSWDVNIVNAFIDLPVPVLIVPMGVHYRPIEKIAFACNYYRAQLNVPMEMIRKLVQFTRAKLFVIQVVSPAELVTEEGLRNKAALQEGLADLSPVYYEPAFTNVVTAIDQFTEEAQIDLLLVIPTRHGIWYNIFQQSHTKGLVYLNHIPVLSLRQGAFLNRES